MYLSNLVLIVVGIILIMAGILCWVQNATGLEIGDVWEDEPRGDPFDKSKCSARKVLALKEGYVQYEIVAGDCVGVVRSMQTSTFKFNANKISWPKESEQNNGSMHQMWWNWSIRS